MQFDFVRFLNLEGEKFRFFHSKSFVSNIFCTSTKHILQDTVRRNFVIDFFRTFINKPTELNRDSIRFFFYCGSKIVSFHPAKGRPVHAVFIILSASTEMCSASWYR